MAKCVIKGCPNTHRHVRKIGRKITFYTFPKNKEIAKKWLEIAGLEKMPSSWARICADHFRPEALKPKTWVQQQLDYLPSKGSRRLRDDAIPTENLSADLTEDSAITVQKYIKKMDEEKDRSELKINLLADDLSEPETSDARNNSEPTDEEIFPEPTDEEIFPEPADEELFPEPTIDTDVEIDHEDLVAKYIKEKKKVVLWKTLCEIYRERAEFAEKQLQEILDKR